MKPMAVLTAVACVALIVTGCGSSKQKASTNTTSSSVTAANPPSKTTPPQGKAAGASLKLSADPGGALKFTASSLNAKSGKVIEAGTAKLRKAFESLRTAYVQAAKLDQVSV